MQNTMGLMKALSMSTRLIFFNNERAVLSKRSIFRQKPSQKFFNKCKILTLFSCVRINSTSFIRLCLEKCRSLLRNSIAPILTRFKLTKKIILWRNALKSIVYFCINISILEIALLSRAIKMIRLRMFPFDTSSLRSIHSVFSLLFKRI